MNHAGDTMLCFDTTFTAEIEFVDALPIGPTGKVLKRQLREKFNREK